MPVTTEFEQAVTETIADLQKQVQTLSAKHRTAELLENTQEPKKTATIRMPSSLYDKIQAEAKSLKVSMNQLCMLKLAQPFDPGDAGQ